MSSVEEINALREELANKRAARKDAEVDGVSVQRQAELDAEAEKLRREIAEEDAVAALLAGAGQNPPATEVVINQRTDEEILLASAAATAIANGATQEEVNAQLAKLKDSKAEGDDKVNAKPENKLETPKLTGAATPATGTSTANTGALKEEEK